MSNLINQIPVIFYHSVSFKKECRWVKNFLTIELPYFEDFLKYLQKEKYETVDLRYCTEVKKGIIKDKAKKICITFDDGYADNWVFVYPLLKKYQFKGTIFVNPENIDDRPVVRKTLEDYWQGKSSANELEAIGFLSWKEMGIMHNSGIIDFQSHTMSHTKYFISDEIIGFHKPGSTYIYPIWNLFPGTSKNYFVDNQFERQIPYGYPLFKEASSVIARKVTISEDFINKAVELYNESNVKKLNYEESLHRLISLRNDYLKNNSIIDSIESEEEYKQRVEKELYESKQILENKLNKRIEFCCWPHGENTPEVHKMAIKCGYVATTIGKMKIDPSDPSRIHRFALGVYKNNRLLTLKRASFKLHAFEGKQPYYLMQEFYRLIKGIK